jgi:hypothetical protein
MLSWPHIRTYVLFTIFLLHFEHLNQIRIFLVTAKYCTYAVWQADRKRLIDIMRDCGLLSLKILSEYFTCWWYVQFYPLSANDVKYSALIGDTRWPILDYFLLRTLWISRHISASRGPGHTDYGWKAFKRRTMQLSASQIEFTKANRY